MTFSQWMKTKKLTIDGLSKITGVDKKTIVKLRGQDVGVLENARLSTFLKLQRSFPKTNFKTMFPFLSEF